MKQKKYKAFTLIELFVVLTIISLLMLMVVTNVKIGKETAQKKSVAIETELSYAREELDKTTWDK